MKKLTFIVPILLGGERLPNKNLAMVDGQPLCTYAINELSKVIDTELIYVVYEDDIIRTAITRTEPCPHVNFVKRDPSRGGSSCEMKSTSFKCEGQRCQVHDHYLYDIFQKLDSEWIIQLHTTSPLISSNTLHMFINRVKSSSKDMILSTTMYQKEAFFNNEPINFNPICKTPTQQLVPVKVVCWALTAWRKAAFINAYNSGASPSFLKSIEYFDIPLNESDDVDTLEELLIVENKIRGKRLGNTLNDVIFFNEEFKGIERELHRLLRKDGSSISEEAMLNMFGKVSLSSIIQEMGTNTSWSYPIMVYGQDQACLIHQLKGDQCRKHFHISKSEFWAVLQGEFEWILENKTVIVRNGDFMRLKPGEVHTIKSIGNVPGIRLAMGGFNMEHIYLD